VKVFFRCERHVNDAPLIRIHRPEGEGDTRCSNTVGSMTSHSSKLRFTSCAKIFNVADDAFFFGKSANESLIKKVLQGFKQLAAFAQQKGRVRAFYVQETTALFRINMSAQLKTRTLKYGVEKVLSL
jgi:hypothetical protein